LTKDIPPHLALFSLGTVVQLTGLTARQIRYYEKHSLITPARNKGNQRVFSLQDIYVLMQIKRRMDKGINIAGIKELKEFENRGNVVVDLSALPHEGWSEEELREIIKEKIERGDLS